MSKEFFGFAVKRIEFAATIARNASKRIEFAATNARNASKRIEFAATNAQNVPADVGRRLDGCGAGMGELNSQTSELNSRQQMRETRMSELNSRQQMRETRASESNSRQQMRETSLRTLGGGWADAVRGWGN